MKVSTSAKVLCTAAPLVGAFAHVALFYIGWPFPYPVIGAIAVVCGVLGLMRSISANWRNPDKPVSKIFTIMAIIGILVGLFYASMIGPAFVFMPRI